ncbi:TPA: hypothetical protein JD836_14900 [Citrobacter freundii]|nr:hypothetical protein [Citrobacter freundii]HCD1268089.1 hypothetical protein [Citrobacter freundii]
MMKISVKKQCIFTPIITIGLAALVALNQAHASELVSTDNVVLLCAESTESVISELNDTQVAQGMVDTVIQVCATGYQVGQAGDEATNADNIGAFNANIADPKADLNDAQRLKAAYIIGFNLGVLRG